MLANAAIVTGAISFFIWAATQMILVIQKRLEKREKEIIALVQFHTDVRLRARYLPKVMTPSAVEHFERIIEDYELKKKSLRFYGAQVSDQRSFERINEALHRFSPNKVELVSEYMQLDRLFVIQYDKLQSEDFERMSAARQIAALRDCAASARELQDLAERLTVQMPDWTELKRWHVKYKNLTSDQGSDRSHGGLARDNRITPASQDKM